MNLERRVEKLERAAGGAAGRSGTATVLVTDADGADFLASANAKDYGGGDLIITNGVFDRMHKFEGGLTADDNAAISKLRQDYETVAVFEIAGYHLRLMGKAIAARQAGKLA